MLTPSLLRYNIGGIVSYDPRSDYLGSRNVPSIAQLEERETVIG